MTDATRLAALEAVATALAEALTTMQFDGHPLSPDALRALADYDALPAPATQPAGEVVEVRAFVGVANGQPWVIYRERDQYGVWSLKHEQHAVAEIVAQVPREFLERKGYKDPIPLPTVPVITATVERGE